jgi:hypothetical protein
MNLTVKNFEKNMFELFNSNSNWLESYKALEEIYNQDSNDIGENFNARFIYNMIKNKVDLEQFSQVISHIYQTDDKWALSIELNDFFVPDEVNLGIAAYCKLDKYNNKQSFTDNMTYLFLDFDKSKPNGKKLLLDKKNLPYLLVMTNEVKEDTVEILRVAGYYSFIKNFSHNVEEIKPLIEMAQNNEAFQKSETGQYSNFFSSLLSDIGHNSYEKELYPNQNKLIYKSLSKVLKNADDVIVEALFRPTRSNQLEKVSIDLGLLNYCLLIESEIDIISKIDEKYQQLLCEVKPKKAKNDYNSLRAQDKVIQSFYAPMSVSFREHNFKLDCSKIDITKDFRENYIYLKLMEIKIKNKQDLEISKEVCQYVIKLYDEKSKKNDDDIMTSLFDIDTYLKKETILPYIKKYMQYKELDGSLEKNEESKKKKMKV